MLAGESASAIIDLQKGLRPPVAAVFRTATLSELAALSVHESGDCNKFTEQKIL